MGNLCFGRELPKAAEVEPPPATTAPAATAQTAAAPPPVVAYDAAVRRLAATPTLDEKRLRELQGVVDVRETLHGFIKHARQQLDSLVASVEARDPSAARVAHALKGAAKTVGAARLAACAEAIEDEAKREGADVGACGRFLLSLRAALDDLAAEVCSRPWR